MNRLFVATGVEFRKMFRSRVPLITFIIFLIVPFMAGFFMLMMRDPTLMQKMGAAGTKAEIKGFAADWPSLFNMVLQAVSIGGLLLFGFVTSWIFGREYSDRTVKDLLALPIPRTSTVFAKFIVILTWCSVLCTIVLVLSMAVGSILGLPGLTGALINKSLEHFAICSLLTMLLCPPVAFFASAGKGYLSPLGFVVLTLVFAQVVAAAGAGPFFPWAVPTLFSGAAGDGALSMPVVSAATVVFVCVLGCAGTALWWRYADQT